MALSVHQLGDAQLTQQPITTMPETYWAIEASGVGDVTDGIGTPDPNPRNVVNWCL